MKKNNLSNNLIYNEEKPAVNVLLETDHSKEIRILLKKGQLMKEHKTPFPILVEVFRGRVDFGVRGEIHHLSEGDIIALEGNVPHDLVGTEDSIIRLTLSKSDTAERVRQVAQS